MRSAREVARLGILIRALLSATSLVVLIPVAYAVIGGYFPTLPVIGPFGLILNTGLPWVLGAAALGTGLAGLAVALGGRKTAVLLAAGVALLAGSGIIAYRYVSFAEQHAATYDIVRAIDGFPPIAEPDDKTVITTADGADLRTELWLPVAAATAAGSLPGVVFVHGGAFIGGAPGTRPLMLDALRRAGIVGIDIDYRLSPPPRWNVAPGDVLCSLAWLRSAPALTAIDPSRVVVVGESAGGSLALMAGYAAGTNAIASSCPAMGPPVVPAGVVAIAPTADLAGIWDDATIYDGPDRRFPEAYIGGPPSLYPDRYDAASPFRLLRPDLPPTLVVSGEIDRLVLIDRSIALAERIRAAGASAELLVAPFAGHGFDGEPNSFGNQLAEGVVRDFVVRVTAGS
jgi:acetyl esterase/lipase